MGNFDKKSRRRSCSPQPGSAQWLEPIVDSDTSSDTMTAATYDSGYDSGSSCSSTPGGSPNSIAETAAPDGGPMSRTVSLLEVDIEVSTHHAEDHQALAHAAEKEKEKEKVLDAAIEKIKAVIEERDAEKAASFCGLRFMSSSKTLGPFKKEFNEHLDRGEKVKALCCFKRHVPRFSGATLNAFCGDGLAQRSIASRVKGRSQQWPKAIFSEEVAALIDTHSQTSKAVKSSP